MSILGKLPLCVIQYPTGRWGFVGRVPAQLAYLALDGGPCTEEQYGAAAQCGPRVAGVKGRSWTTKASALEDAAAIGAEVQA